MNSIHNSDYITASFDTLVGQATDTASEFMRIAKNEIDKTFGDGFAKEHPELIAAFMQAASADLGTATSGKVLGAALQEISSSINQIASALES